MDNAGRVWFTSPFAELSVLDGETWNPFDLTFMRDEYLSPRRLAQGPNGRAWMAGVRLDGIVVYDFTALELTINRIQEHLIPPIAVPAGESLLPTVEFLDEEDNPISSSGV